MHPKEKGGPDFLDITSYSQELEWEILPNSSVTSLWPIIVFSVDGFALCSALYIIRRHGPSGRDTKRMEESYLP